MKTEIVVNADSESRQQIMITTEEQIGFDFHEISEDNTGVSIARFAMRPHELKTAIIAYLNSVPSQEDIANSINTPISIFDGKKPMETFIADIDMILKREPIPFIQEYGFIKGRDVVDSPSEETPFTSVFWWVDKESGWRDYIDMHRFSQQFMRSEGIYNFVQSLKSKKK